MLKGFLLIGIVVAVIIGWPLAIIWAVNSLFGLGIAYTFLNWVAVVVLTAAFGKTNVNIPKK
jgi:hypothetical protein